MNKVFYVYTHSRPDGSVFYIGKGKDKRAYSKKSRSQHWKNIVEKHGEFKIDFIAKELEEELAFLAEMEAIDIYRSRGTTLINLTDGGEGSSGAIVSEETRKRMSEAQKENPGNDGFLGRKHSAETLLKMSEVKKGKKMSESMKLKSSLRMKGNKIRLGKSHSAETIEKMKLSHQLRLSKGVDNV